MCMSNIKISLLPFAIIVIDAQYFVLQILYLSLSLSWTLKCCKEVGLESVTLPQFWALKIETLSNGQIKKHIIK